LYFFVGDILTNSKARRDYFILETVEAGIVLKGTEVKSLRAGRGQIRDAFAKIENGQINLYNAHIDEYSFGNRLNHNPKANRRLLLHKSEIRKLELQVMAKGTALIPLGMYWKKNRVKVRLGLGKGKAEYDKRNDIRKRDAEEEVRRAMSYRQKNR
jgi:SsrA-binding protein